MATPKTLAEILENSPFAEENEKILKSCNAADYEKAFESLLLEVLDFESGLQQAKTAFTNALLTSGAHENPHGAYEYIEHISTRLGKIHIIKRLVNMLGLQSEYEAILANEMELIYKGSASSRKSVFVTGDVVAGETRN